jgi:uncharacterized repeat protein (TIGR01451 family)
VLALAACGGSSTNLSVKLALVDPTQTVRPGDDVNYMLTVSNDGPAEATGVTVRVDLPIAFHYKSTPSIDSSGTTTRTQPSDPQVNSGDPQWGEWSMGPPGINADGSPAHSRLFITLDVQAGGSPSEYPLTPHVFSDSTDEVVGTALKVRLAPASDLSLTIAVDEQQAKHGDLVHYHLSLLNAGSGAAKGVGILVTLPDGIVFNKTEQLSGSYTRSNPIDPISGALIVYYGGWTLPPASAARPGTLNILFTAKVLATAVGGTYPVTAQLTASDGTLVQLNNSAPVTIVAPTPSPTPSPSPGSHAGTHPTPTPAPVNTPAPTPTPRKHG